MFLPLHWSSFTPAIISFQLEIFPLTFLVLQVCFWFMVFFLGGVPMTCRPGIEAAPPQWQCQLLNPLQFYWWKILPKFMCLNKSLSCCLFGRLFSLDTEFCSEDALFFGCFYNSIQLSLGLYWCCRKVSCYSCYCSFHMMCLSSLTSLRFSLYISFTEI